MLLSANTTLYAGKRIQAGVLEGRARRGTNELVWTRPQGIERPPESRNRSYAQADHDATIELAGSGGAVTGSAVAKASRGSGNEPASRFSSLTSSRDQVCTASGGEALARSNDFSSQQLHTVTASGGCLDEPTHQSPASRRQITSNSLGSMSMGSNLVYPQSAPSDEPSAAPSSSTRRTRDGGSSGNGHSTRTSSHHSSASWHGSAGPSLPGHYQAGARGGGGGGGAETINSSSSVKSRKDETVDMDPSLSASASRALNAIHLAAQHGRLGVLRLLLDTAQTQQAAPDINMLSSDGQSALRLAASNDHNEIVLELLERGADPLLQDSELGQTAMHMAAASGCAATLCILLDWRPDARAIADNAGVLPFHWAIINGYEDIVQIFLDRGADSQQLLTSSG